MAMKLESSSVADGEPITPRYAVATPTAEGRSELAGGDRSPHLAWAGEPDGTRSFAVTVVDPDVPADKTRMGVEGLRLGDDEQRVDFAHWLLADVPASVHEIAEGADGDGFVASGKPPGHTSFGAINGANGYGGLFEGNDELAGVYGGWDGPYPPWNDDCVHRYLTTVYALDVESLGLGPGFSLDDLRRAMEGHVLDEAQIVPTYTLNPALR